MWKQGFLIAALAAGLYAGDACTYRMKSGVTVDWTAFKTPLKKGVKGTFRSVVYRGKMSAENLSKLLAGSQVSIDANNVDSGNPGRDAKLAKFFFGKMAGRALEAKIAGIDETRHIVSVEISMNGRHLVVPMRYTYENGTFNAAGVLDLADFGALDALKSINKACYALHQGKTWQDVEVGFGVRIAEHCAQ